MRGFAAALRERGGYGVSHASVSQYETGTTVPAGYVEAVARAFGIGAEWLLTGEGPEELVEPSAVERAFRQIAAIVEATRPGPPVLEAQLDAFFRLSADLFCILTPDGYFTRTNPAWSAVLGWDPPALLDATLAELLHPEDVEPVLQLLRPAAALRPENGHSAVARVRDAAGGYRWISWSMTASGGLVHAVGRDITEQRRAVERLQAEHTVTRVLAESAHFDEAAPEVLRAACECFGWCAGAIWMPDAAGTALSVHAFWAAPECAGGDFDRATRALTLEPGQGMVGGVWSGGEPAWVPDVTASRDYIRAEAARRDGLRAAYAFPVRTGSEIFAVMEFYAHEAREPEPELLRTMLSIGSQFGQFRKRTNVESALRGERDLSSLILETVGVLVMLLDPEGRVVRLNSECERVIGYSTAELFGRDVISTLVPPAEVDQVNAIFDRLRAGEMPVGVRHHLRSRSGQSVLVSWNCRSLAGRDGRVAYIVRAGVVVPTEPSPPPS